MTFNDAEGNPCSEQSVLVYSKNIRDTFEQVVKGRGIRDPHTNLGIDGGQGKVVVTLHVHDRANTDEDDRDDKKPGGASRGIVLARADRCVETRDNVEHILNKIGVPEFLMSLPPNRYHIIGDLKTANEITGMIFITLIIFCKVMCSYNCCFLKFHNDRTDNVVPEYQILSNLFF